MSEMNELYKRAIFDHNRNPRNFKEMEDATHSCDGYNPLCGDKVKVFVRLNEAGNLEDVSFTGSGCAIFKASASFMTSHVKGKSQVEAVETATKFMELVKGTQDLDPDDQSMNKLTIFQGVREFPSRVKCATLAWHALSCALGHETEDVEKAEGQGGVVVAE